MYHYFLANLDSNAQFIVVDLDNFLSYLHYIFFYSKTFISKVLGPLFIFFKLLFLISETPNTLDLFNYFYLSILNTIFR